MHNKLALAVVLAWSSTAALGAGLAEITERALANNPEVRARMYDFLSAGEEQDAARGGLRPRLDLETFYGRQRLDAGNTTDVDTFNHSGVVLQLRQLLFDGFATSREIRRLGYTKATRYYELLASTDETALETARAYLDVQRYRQLTALSQDNWAVHKEIYDQIEQRVRAGVGRRVDLEQAAGRLALAQSNWLTETSNLHDVSARFQRVVGEAPPALADAPDLTRHLPDDRSVVEEAIRNSPNFLAAVANLRAARALTDVRRAAKSPTLELRASQNIEKNRLGSDGIYRDTLAQIVLNYNIFRGGADDARVRAAQMQYNAAEEQRDRSCRDVRQVSSIAWHDMRRLLEQIRFLEQHLLSTEKARDAYRQQFDIGQRTLLDLLDTENELFEARRALTRAEHDYRFAQFRVLAATHRLLPALGLAPARVGRPDEALGGDLAADNAARCDTSTPAFQPLDLAAASAARTALRPAPTAPAAIPAPAAPPATPAPVPPASVPAQCEFAARDWAAAWSARDLGKYLGYYSSDFLPLTRADREDWRRFRAQRLNKPSISVKLENVTARQMAPDRCEVSFEQRYRSSDYNDDVAKRLVLKREGTAWKIIQEIAPKKSGTN